jgi:hypothetical protein
LKRQTVVCRKRLRQYGTFIKISPSRWPANPPGHSYCIGVVGGQYCDQTLESLP